MNNNIFLNRSNKSRLKKKIICRGQGSGYGKTGGRGHKGQKSRSGYKNKRSFEGGQTSIFRRIPKFGFKNNNRKKIFELKLSALSIINDNYIDMSILKKYKLVNKKYNFVKIILDKSNNILLNKTINSNNLLFSKGAKKVIDFYECNIE